MSQSAGHRAGNPQRGDSKVGALTRKESKETGKGSCIEGGGKEVSQSSGETGGCISERWLQESGAAWEGLVHGEGAPW